LLSAELDIGFLQLALLGINVRKGALFFAEANYEGRLSVIKCADLAKRLIDDSWVPAGRAQVLSWLALGGRVGRRRLMFDGLTGGEVFDRIVPA
jgi:hypothetical protein